MATMKTSRELILHIKQLILSKGGFSSFIMKDVNSVNIFDKTPTVPIFFFIFSGRTSERRKWKMFSKV